MIGAIKNQYSKIPAVSELVLSIDSFKLKSEIDWNKPQYNKHTAKILSLVSGVSRCTFVRIQIAVIA